MKRILVSLIGILLFWEGQRAFADTCAVSLMPAFTANQAKGLCKTFGSAVNQSLIPNADNTLDLGSASFTWRTLYTGTSRIAKTSDILRVRQDAQRLFTWDGSADNSLTQTWGDGGTTASVVFGIYGSTADADDDYALVLGGGGDGSSARGSFFTSSGNERATTGGQASVVGGNVTTGDVKIQTTNSTPTIQFLANDALRWSIGNSGALTQDATNGGNIILQKTGTTIAVDSGTAASTCSGTLTANGATPVVTNTTCALTASRIFLSKQSASTAVNGSCTVTAISNGVSFTVACLATDTGTYNFWITQEG